jgi:hypothetical protein
MLKLNKNIKKYFHTKKTLVSKVYQPLLYIYNNLLHGIGPNKSVTIIRILTNERTFMFIYLFIFLTVRGGHLSNVRIL